jgi:hypothetical protein
VYFISDSYTKQTGRHENDFTALVYMYAQAALFLSVGDLNHAVDLILSGSLSDERVQVSAALSGYNSNAVQ